MSRHNENRWTIREATSGDGPALAALLRGLGWFAHMDRESPQATEARTMQHLRLCLEDESHTVLVAEDGAGAIAAYAAVHWLPYLILAGPEGYVSELFVAEPARGSGAGKQLLESIQEMAVSRGCSRLMLLNRKSRESYQRRFYPKLGWEERQEFANFVLHLPDPGR